MRWRAGGEEFVILLPGAGTENALSTVSRLQRELTTHVFLHGPVAPSSRFRPASPK
jgi:GGDEF domain-containing protein